MGSAMPTNRNLEVDDNGVSPVWLRNAAQNSLESERYTNQHIQPKMLPAGCDNCSFTDRSCCVYNSSVCRQRHFGRE